MSRQSSKDGSWIGLDESGKGDYFGPLVVAGVHVTPAISDRMLALGIRDSKRVSDSRVLKMEPEIRSLARCAVVAIGPERYNKLYDKMRNLNHLLAWAHARTLENLLGEVQCQRALADQFGDKKLIEKALMEKGKTILLEQRHRAEDDMAVAAASIIARAEFLKRLRRLAEETQLELPKGAGQPVLDACRKLAEKFPAANEREMILTKVAKWHFKTTKQVMVF